MLSLQNIKEYYPKHKRGYERFILREYLQYKILEIIYESNYASSLMFMGGTALRIIYGNDRFSEDLDFDNFGLSETKFEAISKLIKKKLELQGYEVSLKNVMRGAYHCHIKFPGLLKNYGLSGFERERILIRLDTDQQLFDYQPDWELINKFDVFTQIAVVPQDILLAQKFYAVLNRPRNKGRDFYDIVFLLGRNVKPNYNYLIQKANITNGTDLKKRILEKAAGLNMQEMATDVSPFLFDRSGEKRVLLFENYLTTVEL